MPTKGKLPTAREMEGQVLAALQELKGEDYYTEWGEIRYTEIDERVKENLEPMVLLSQFSVKSQSFYETTFANKCAQARRELRKQGFLAMGIRKGHWRFNQVPAMKPSKKRKPGTSRVSNFAAEAIELLEKQRISRSAIKSIEDLFIEFLMAGPEVQPNHAKNLEVEAKAIDFILAQEKDWQRPENRNNPGFDLYQTDRKGTPNLWCEVKGLSGKFNGVSLTHTEFKEALKRGKRYWLYIVENVGSYDPKVKNAGKNHPTLIKINDPAGKAERFTYRHPAWRKAADEILHANPEKRQHQEKPLL